MFNKKKDELKKELKDEQAKYEEMEVAEEFGDGWFVAGVATGIAIGVAVVLT